MTKRTQASALSSHHSFRSIGVALAIAWSFMILIAQPAQAQSLTVLYTFSGNAGLYPYSGVTLDGAGNLYGTTYGGGAHQAGVVYELKLHGSSYIYNQLYAFTGGDDSGDPLGGVIFGPQGILYGTTSGEGFDTGGTVFSLRPPPTFCRSVLCPWTETVLYDVANFNGVQPTYGQVAFDQSGNIYGTTAFGGPEEYGDVYELSPESNSWTGMALYSFGDPDAMYPGHNVVLDSAGNLYGTTDEGGSHGEGTVFQLVRSGSGWSENIIANLGAPGSGIGGYPVAGLIMDRAGNFYGGTAGDGATASVFEVSRSGNSWQLTPLHTFAESANSNGPWGSLAIDSSGILYGTTNSLGANGLGNVFKLSPSGGAWTYTDLYDFSNTGDGEYPTGDLTIDANGNLFGTNLGADGHGVVWELTQ